MRTKEVHCAKCLEIFKDQLFNTVNGLYIYDETNGLWTSDEYDIMRVVDLHSNEIFINWKDSVKQKTLLSLYDSALPLVKARAPFKAEFLADTKKNRGFFLFFNGVLDCSTFTMRPFSADLFFTRRIHRDFDPLLVNDEDEVAVIEKLFNSAYTVPGSEPNTEEQFLFKGDFDTSKRDLVLQKLSRGLILGGVDKEFLMLLGETNCGKGVLTQFLEHTFHEYVGTFNTPNLQQKKCSLTFDGKRWAWIANLWDCRLIIGNHLAQKPLNADMLKALVTDGDKITYKLLYQNAVEVEMMACLVVFDNDYHFVKAVERALIIYADRSSSTEDTFDAAEFFKADTTIKDVFNRSTKLQDAFIRILCKYYQRSL